MGRGGGGGNKTKQQLLATIYYTSSANLRIKVGIFKGIQGYCLITDALHSFLQNP
jgi:hypothetical protein